MMTEKETQLQAGAISVKLDEALMTALQEHQYPSINSAIEAVAYIAARLLVTLEPRHRHQAMANLVSLTMAGLEHADPVAKKLEEMKTVRPS